MSDGSVGPEEKAYFKATSNSPGLGIVNSSRESGSEDFNLDLLIERGDWPGVITASRIASEKNDCQREESKQAAQHPATSGGGGIDSSLRFI